VVEWTKHRQAEGICTGGKGTCLELDVASSKTNEETNWKFEEENQNSLFYLFIVYVRGNGRDLL